MIIKKFFGALLRVLLYINKIKIKDRLIIFKIIIYKL